MTVYPNPGKALDIRDHPSRQNVDRSSLPNFEHILEGVGPNRTDVPKDKVQQQNQEDTDTHYNSARELSFGEDWRK